MLSGIIQIVGKVVCLSVPVWRCVIIGAVGGWAGVGVGGGGWAGSVPSQKGCEGRCRRKRCVIIGSVGEGARLSVTAPSET